MAAKKSTTSPATRLDMGAAILLAAKINTVQSIKRRLDAFTRVHRRYTAAQSRVDAVDAQIQAAQASLAANDAAQDGAVEALARALIFGGHLRRNPFAAFGADSPWAIKNLAPGDEASAIHHLVAAVQRQSPPSAETAQATQVAEKAARAVEATLGTLVDLQGTSRQARQRRDTIGDSWDKSLAALKRGARAAIDDGAPGLYSALFGRFARTKSKKPQPEKSGAPAQQEQPQPLPIPPSPASTVTPEPVVSG
jgi:hypothetical protein